MTEATEPHRPFIPVDGTLFLKSTSQGVLHYSEKDCKNPGVSMYGQGFLSEERLKSIMRQTDMGNHSASRQQLFATLYDELRRIAQRELQRSGSAITVGATTLLHELYLDLQGRRDVMFPDRARFFAYASRAMRGLIIDYARSRQALKRGAAFEITTIPTELPNQAVESAELERLDDAVERLAAVEPRLAQVVDLKYFGGFSFGDIAAMWGVSERTVQRDWEKARLFLYRCVSNPEGT